MPNTQNSKHIHIPYGTTHGLKLTIIWQYYFSMVTQMSIIIIWCLICVAPYYRYSTCKGIMHLVCLLPRQVPRWLRCTKVTKVTNLEDARCVMRSPQNTELANKGLTRQTYLLLRSVAEAITSVVRAGPSNDAPAILQVTITWTHSPKATHLCLQGPQIFQVHPCPPRAGLITRPMRCGTGLGQNAYSSLANTHTHIHAPPQACCSRAWAILPPPPVVGSCRAEMVTFAIM